MADLYLIYRWFMILPIKNGDFPDRKPFNDQRVNHSVNSISFTCSFISLSSFPAAENQCQNILFYELLNKKKTTHSNIKITIYPVMKHGNVNQPFVVEFPSYNGSHCHLWWHRRVSHLKSPTKDPNVHIVIPHFYPFQVFCFLHLTHLKWPKNIPTAQAQAWNARSLSHLLFRFLLRLQDLCNLGGLTVRLRAKETYF